MPYGSGPTGSVHSTKSSRLVNVVTPTRPQNNPATTANLNPGPYRPPKLANFRSGAPAGPAAQVPSNVWNNNGGGRRLTGNLAHARAPSQVQRSAAPVAAPQVPNAQAPVRLASQLANMNISPSAASYNPSIGPTPSTLTTNWRQQAVGASQASNFSCRGAVSNAVCKQSGLGKQHFKKGEIITIPFHTANMNPNTDPTDRRLTITCEGPAYSKRRMMVILWLHKQEMFCLPLFSYSGTGLAKKQSTIEEHVAVKNEGDLDFVNQGVYKPIEAICRKKKLTNTTTIHLVCGIKVNYSENICRVGRITETSHQRLVQFWLDLSEGAQNEVWRQ